MRYTRLTDEEILEDAKRLSAGFIYRGHWQFYEPNLLEFARKMISVGVKAADIEISEACAAICDDEAAKMEREVQAAINGGHHDEVSSLRSTAWQLSIAAARIRDRLNCANKNGE